MAKILILTNGSAKCLQPFLDSAEKLSLDVTTASFSKINFSTQKDNAAIFVNDQNLKDFSVVYIRLIGKSLETAALVIEYCRQNNIRVVDRRYIDVSGLPTGLPKSIETRRLFQSSLPIPKTIFGRLNYLRKIAPQEFGYPFVFKMTDGRKSNGVWAPKDKNDLEEILKELKVLEKSGKKFLAQQFLYASQRNRILVIGDKPIVCITRGTIWRRRFIHKVNGEIPEKITAVVDPIPQDEAFLAVKAAQALGIEIAGVDLMREDYTNNLYLLEVNSAPRWVSVEKDTKINVEEQVLLYLASLV